MTNSLKFILLFASVFFLSCGPKKVTCPDGQVAFVQRNPEKQYRQYVKSSENNIKSTINILDKIKLDDIGVSTKQQVVLLRQQLDQYSARNEDVLKSSFLYVNTKPCDTAGQREHNRLLKELNTTSSEVEKLKLQLEASFNNEAKVKSIIENYFLGNTIKTCNRGVTDNFYFLLVIDSNKVQPFTLQVNDVEKIDTLQKIITSFLGYTSVDEKKFFNEIKVFRTIDEKIISINSKSDVILQNCNTGLLLIPGNVIRKYESEHLAFVMLKSKTGL